MVRVVRQFGRGTVNVVELVGVVEAGADKPGISGHFPHKQAFSVPVYLDLSDTCPGYVRP